MATNILYNQLTKPVAWVHAFLFKHVKKYGRVVYLPDNGPDWERFIGRCRGGTTGIEGDPKDAFNLSAEYTISREIRDWSIEQKIKMKYRFEIDIGNATYPRNPRLVLELRFLSLADAAQFKLTFL
jgi:hypothetical protein